MRDGRESRAEFCNRNRQQMVAGEQRKMISFVPLFLALLLFCDGAALASHHYTDKQLEALAERVGKTFWFNPAQEKTPLFSATPAPSGAIFRPAVKESFEITELTGQAIKDPYYKVRFDSGKVAYIRPEMFHEELNATILSVDPWAEARKKKEQGAEEEKTRVDWINAQPWSQAVKEASLRKQPTLGLNSAEIKRAVGPPIRITKTRGAIKVAEEHWFYADGSVLTFHNGLLSKVEKREK